MSWHELYGTYTLMAVASHVTHPFDSNAAGFAFQIDGVEGNRTVFVFENPDDGYRSSAITPMIVHANMYEFGYSPEYIRTTVIIKEWTKEDYPRNYSYVPDGVEGIVMYDQITNLPVLYLGTQNTDDYYPSYTAEWLPQNLTGNYGR